MPVKRIGKAIDSMPKQWLTQLSPTLSPIEATIEQNSEDSNESFKGYKTSLNDSVVDDLVTTLTNKLCLKSTHRLCRSSRLSPYQIHNSSVYRSQPNHCCCLNCKYLIESNTKTNAKTGLKRSSSMSDTYELMQQLLKEGSLIKEAVKRLQYEGQQPVEPMASKKSIDFYIDSSDEDFNQNENQINLLNS